MLLSVAAHGSAWLAWVTWKPTHVENAYTTSGLNLVTASIRLVSSSASPPAGAGTQAVINDNMGSERDWTSSPMADSSGSPSRFIPADRLDGPVVPKSSPDFSRLRGLYFSGLPIRLRILIDESGKVQEVVALQSTTSDMPAVEQIKAMLMDTAYIPGLLHGAPVPTQMDVELNFSDLE